MTSRHLALICGAVLVLAMGVYLYLAVQSTSPAVANVGAATERRETQPHKSPRKVPEARAERAAPSSDKAPSTITAKTSSTDATPLDETAIMASANRAYDVGDFDEAMTIAKRVLSGAPGNVRMLRIMVSASCILGDVATAQQNYLLLPDGGKDRADMKRRCDLYGIALADT